MTKRLLFFMLLPALVTSPISVAAQDAAGTSDLGLRLDIVWILVAAALVFMMQIGFMLLEAGMVRSKNSINVAQKNLLDFVFSVLVFAGFGFMLAFGTSSAFAPVGWDMNLLGLADLDSWTIAFFVFQVMFCGTAATIVSGAVAERMKLPAYVLGTVVMAGLIYPVFVHWSWGSALGDASGAWLAHLGFVDFAGSTVVHATGAWMALAACIVLGPRLGRFTPEGKPVRIAGHSPVLATSGALLLFFGWIGFNGGSTVAASFDIAHIIANTMLAGSAGAVAGYFLGYWQDKVILPEKAVAGMLGGLVAVTAGCMVLDGPGATIIGLLGGLSAVWGNSLLEKFGIDDAVNAIGVHGFAGVLGTLGLAVLAPAGNLPLGNAFAQLQVQAIAVGVNFAWAFSTGFIFFKLLDTFLPVRVNSRHEERGLNETEHATRLGIGHVEQAMQALASGTAGLDTRLAVDAGDEAEHLTRIFNELMERLQKGEIIRSREVELQRSDEEAERLTALADATFEGLCICVDGEIIDGNGALEDLFGLPVAALKSRRIVDFIAPEDYAAFSRHVADGSGTPQEISVRHNSGDVTPVEVRGRSIIYKGRRAEVIAIVDLRERKKAEQQIRFLAQHDPLTNLPNRALFNEKLSAMIKRTIAAGVSSSVVLIDLDHFKDINDLHGHPAGDEVIKVTAERLRRNVAPGDMVARLGGDEFAVLQMTVEFASQAEDLAMRLINELSRPVEVAQGLRIHPSASIGVAICPRDGLQGEQLISRADTALYHAKNSGRNRYSIFELGMDQELRRRQMLEADMADAIEQNQFELYFQPRLDLASTSITGYEALIRWNHPSKGLVSPADFIPVAENSGKIIAIGNWVMETACRMAAEQFGGTVSVNVSPRQFAEKGFVETLELLLDNTGLAPERLEIEITESILIEDDRLAVAILNRLKALGVRVALDDFGTGYSSLAYLSRFPFDTIKIDRSFVENLKNEEDAVAIVDTIIRLGRALDMRLVAEGVEEVAELEILAARGCHEIQGYLLGRPAPFEHLQVEVPSEIRACLKAVPVKPTLEGISARALNRAAERLRDSVSGEAGSAPKRRTGTG